MLSFPGRHPQDFLGARVRVARAKFRIEAVARRPRRHRLEYRSNVAAQAQGLQGILANRCECAEARQSIKIQFAQQAIFHGELPRIDADLAREGLQAILLKGHALLPYYGVRDLDLLVQRGQLQAARRALGLTGLQSRQVPNDYSIDVDLAEDLVGAERIRAGATAYDFRQEQVWARSRPLVPQYRALRTLDRSYLFCISPFTH